LRTAYFFFFFAAFFAAFFLVAIFYSPFEATLTHRIEQCIESLKIEVKKKMRG
jgi:hypothetical protein